MSLQISSAANVLLLCRLCGTETISQDKLINIFDTNGVALNIKIKISNCLGFDVSDSDYLPKVVCAECVDNLEKFNEFKIKSGKTALYLIDLLTKQISVDYNEPPKQTVSYQDSSLNSTSFDSDLHMKIDEVNHELYTTPTFLVKIPPSNLFNVHNPPSNIKEMIFQSNVCKEIFPTHALSIDHNHTVHKSINKKVKVKSNYVKSQCIDHNYTVHKSSNKKVKVKSNSKKIITKSKFDGIPTEYKCAHCPRVCDTRKKMFCHIKYHFETLINYNCTLCDLKLKSKQSFKTHMKIHNKQYEYVCNYCGKAFHGKTGFDIHVTAAHTKDYPFHCTKCTKKFASKCQLKHHLMTKHNDVFNYTCEICNKSFKTKICLHAHKRIHIPKEKRLKFYCNLCDASFIHCAGFKNHMIGHTGELKFECDLCNKRYKDKKGLSIHLLTHTGEKDHVCDVCGKAFACKSNLVDHRRIHTGERPFQCNLCQKSFTQRSALNRHKKSCSKQQK
jgi:hypothetical protein